MALKLAPPVHLADNLLHKILRPIIPPRRPPLPPPVQDLLPKGLPPAKIPIHKHLEANGSDNMDLVRR